MAVTDDFLAPLLFGSPSRPTDEPRLADAVQALALATADAEPGPRLLAFHLAPIWLRFQIWHPTHAVTRAIEAHHSLHNWLEGALRLEPIARTSPDPLEHERLITHARQTGMLPTP
jgi:hypothetical protein